MEKAKWKIYVQLHWIKILAISAVLIASFILLYLIIVGLYHFINIDPIYRRVTFASMPFTIFFYLIVGSIAAAIHTFIWIYFVFGGGFGRLGQKRLKPEEVNIKWSDVIGLQSVKEEVWEVISLIKDRARLKSVGGKIIKGLLMVGPPGCGKTYLAKAIATETGVPFLSGVGSDFMGIFVGLGASRLKSLFKEARALAKLYGGCIIFIDEIDTIARPRTGNLGFGAGMDYNATVNQLLTELDGLRQEETNIVVIAATNVSEEEFDPALMRAGRFDRKIYLDYPHLGDRKDLFHYYLSKVRYDKNSVDVQVLARKTPYFSPADVANMVREAALVATRNAREAVTMKDLSEAYERILFGLKSGLQLVEKEKIWVAYHEAGHAIVAYLTNPTVDVIKATLIPRKGFLGYAHPVPREELHIDSKEMLLAEIKTSLASYAAERIRFGTTGSGVRADFAHALSIARKMVYSWGMGDSGILGNYYTWGIWNPWYNTLNISQHLWTTLDEDVQKILERCLKEVEEILIKEKELLDYFAQELLKKQELEYDEIDAIFKKHGKERPQAFSL